MIGRCVDRRPRRSDRLPPKNPAHVGRGDARPGMAARSCFARAGYADAEKAYREFSKNDPKNPDAYDGLGVALLYQGEYRGALVSFNKAVKLSPEKPLYRIHRGMAYMQLGQYKEAEEDFRCGRTSTNPEDQLRPRDRARAPQSAAGHYARGGEALRRCARRDPKSMTAYFGRGIGARVPGEDGGGHPGLPRGGQAPPKSAEANLHLGLALVTLQREALGRRYLERMVDLDPMRRRRREGQADPRVARARNPEVDFSPHERDEDSRRRLLCAGAPRPLHDAHRDPGEARYRGQEGPGVRRVGLRGSRGGAARGRRRGRRRPAPSWPRVKARAEQAGPAGPRARCGSLLAEEIEKTARPGAPAPAGRAGRSARDRVFLVGVNGSGKTTTTAKLAARRAGGGQKVLLAAADTFRAGAIEQLEIWGRRLGLDVIRHGEGADPSAVLFDALVGGEGAQGAGPPRRHGRPAPHEAQPHGGARQDAPHRRAGGPGRPAPDAARARRHDRRQRPRPGAPVRGGGRRDGRRPDEARRQRPGRHRARDLSGAEAAGPLRRRRRGPRRPGSLRSADYAERCSANDDEVRVEWSPMRRTRHRDTLETPEARSEPSRHGSRVRAGGARAVHCFAQPDGRRRARPERARRRRGLAPARGRAPRRGRGAAPGRARGPGARTST